MQLGARLGDLMQLSYITRNIDAAVEHAEGALGLTAFHRSESATEVLCEGRVQTLAVKAAIATVGSRQFEIIEPVSGPIHIYTDEVDLSRHILNFHHIALPVLGGHRGWEALIEELRASGDTVAYLFPAVASPEDKVRFCYVDTRHRLGHYTEYLWWDPALDGVGGFPKLDR